MEERRYITDAQAKELAKTEGISITEICPHCRFYVYYAEMRNGTVNVRIQADCIYRQNNDEREQYEMIMGIKFPVRQYCPMPETKCYTYKKENEITKTC